MELRRNNHLHYISAIRCGKVVKSLNVAQGRPSLSFKDINWIMDHEALSHDSEVQTVPSLAVRSLHRMFGDNNVKSQEEIVNPCYTVMHVEPCSGSNKRTHDSDDNFLGEMTLGQLKKRIKTTKRSALISYKEVKKEYGDTHREEDDPDLEETLGSLKFKISRGSKSRKMQKQQKCVSGCDFTAVVKSEPISLDDVSLQMASIDVEPCMKGKESLISMEGPKVCDADPVSSDYIHRTIATSLPLETPDPVEMMKVDSSFISEKQQVCITSQISYEYIEHADDSCLRPETYKHEVAVTVDDSLMATPQPLEIVDCKEMMKVGDLTTEEVVTADLPDPDDVCLSKEDFSTAADCQVCTLNQVSCEHVEYSKGPCSPTQTSNYKEATTADNLIMPPDQPMIAPLSAQAEDKDITSMLTCKESSNAVFPLHHQSVATPRQMQSEGSNCCVEPCTRMESSRQHILPDSECIPISSHDSDLNATPTCGRPLNQDSAAVPDNYGKPVTEETDSSMDNGYPCDDADKSTESAECCELQHPPERLLSTRKTISPTSQERLCMAMKSLDLPDGLESQESKQSFGGPEKQEAHASAYAGGCQVLVDCSRSEHTNTVDTSPKPEQKKKKGKDDKKCARVKGDNKSANTLTPHRLTSSCTFTQSCSENVIVFSQQQMNDIERLAAKLTNELRSMKEIVIDTLQPETRRSTASRYNLNEVRVAVENASKTEETTKRFLAIMARDCNRFCKLMSLTERDGDACSASRPEKEGAEKDASTIQNGGRKIRFADEDGANLCDVRFIEEQESMPSGSPTEHEERQGA